MINFSKRSLALRLGLISTLALSGLISGCNPQKSMDQTESAPATDTSAPGQPGGNTPSAQPTQQPGISGQPDTSAQPQQPLVPNAGQEPSRSPDEGRS
jgi:hypothetical protein